MSQWNVITDKKHNLNFDEVDLWTIGTQSTWKRIQNFDVAIFQQTEIQSSMPTQMMKWKLGPPCHHFLTHRSSPGHGFQLAWCGSSLRHGFRLAWCGSTLGHGFQLAWPHIHEDNSFEFCAANFYNLHIDYLAWSAYCEIGIYCLYITFTVGWTRMLYTNCFFGCILWSSIHDYTIDVAGGMDAMWWQLISSPSWTLFSNVYAQKSFTHLFP
jgi:hypothetical protein